MADFRPVLLGTDLGVYSIARSFHEAYGVRSVVVSNQLRGPIDHSRIIDNVLVGAGAGEEQMVAALVEVARRNVGTPLLLVVNAEHEVEMLVRHRATLEEHYVVPYAPNDVLIAAADKTVLEQVCARLGIATPATRAVDLSAADDGWSPPALDLTFPVVLKPAVSAEHLLLAFEGKRKVYTANTQAEADDVLRRLAAAGLRDVVLAQELIPGDDTQGRTVTCYVDRSGEVTLMASGRLLLQLHAPTMIGNSATILTEPQPEVEEQAAAILRELGFTGFANFDVKVDPRDGRAHFLDLNPRIGRPNYYANVAGRNPARAVVADYRSELGLGAAPPGPLYRPEQEVGVYSYLPWRLVRRYLTDPELRRRVGRIQWTRRFTHPLAYPLDRHPRRTFYRAASTVNLVKDFKKHYPETTPTGL